jgi:starvation-inducible DNA-binding protein
MPQTQMLQDPCSSQLAPACVEKGTCQAPAVYNYSKLPLKPFPPPKENSMRQSKIDIKHNVREPMIALLNARLADAIDLRTHLYQAHWNIKGPNFIALHKMLDEMGAAVEAQIDETAERITALGGTALGTAISVAQNSSLPKYPIDAQAADQHLRALQVSFSTYGAGARAGIDHADEAGDKDTADLFTQTSREVDKFLWFIEAHLEPGK